MLTVDGLGIPMGLSEILEPATTALVVYDIAGWYSAARSATAT